MQYFSFMFFFFARSLFFSCFVLQCSSSAAKSYESINFTRKKFVFTVVENLIQKVSFLQFCEHLSYFDFYYHKGKLFTLEGKLFTIEGKRFTIEGNVLPLREIFLLWRGKLFTIEGKKF